MAGRKPTPTALKLVKGNPGKRRTNKREPKPRRVIPSPPAHLSDEARGWWGWFAGFLDRMGVLTEADAAALEQLCELYVELKGLRKVVEDEGRFYKTTNQNGDAMIRPHPAVAQLADTDRRFRGYLSEFGLTPAARSKVSTMGDDADSDPAEAFFG